MFFEMEDEDEDEDDRNFKDADDDDKPPRKKKDVEKKEHSSKSKEKCPEGHRFGKDFEKKPECGDCDLWDVCSEEKERMKKEKHGN